MPSTTEPRSAALSSVEVVIVMAMALLLGLVGLPRMMETLERERATEAFRYLTRVQSAQTRHLTHHGVFAAELDQLDAPPAPPEHFVVGPLRLPNDAEDFSQGWSLTLTRDGGEGYTVAWTDDGWDAHASTIEEDVCPLQPER